MRASSASLSLSALTLTLVAAACSGDRPRPAGGGPDGGPDATQAPSPPVGWDREVSLGAPMDLAPDPRVLEVNIEANVASLAVVAGTTTSLWAYNGQVPGPLLRAKVGDRVLVHFTNNLPEATTIHWHGIRLDAAMDGTPSAQPPVEPGGHFDYDFVVPDAGLFWYHPHIRSNIQVASGLYGALLVEDPGEKAALGDGVDLGDPVVLVLSDIDVDAQGRLPESNPNDAVASIWGREGNIIWINGRATPTLLAERGRRQRWRLVNAAANRYFSIDLSAGDGSTLRQTFTRIGGDGGLIPAPITSDTLLLAPGQRADVVVAPDAPVGTRLAVRWVPYDRGFGTAIGRDPVDIFYVRIASEAQRPAPATLPSTLRTIAPLDVSSPDVNLQSVLISHGGAGYTVNGESFGGMDAGAVQATVRTTDVWTVANDTEFDHPFHLHGFFFQVLDNTTLLPMSPPEWLDTVNIPQWTSVSFAVRYDDRPGMWMFHCHILDHAEIGLMGMLRVGG